MDERNSFDPKMSVADLLRGFPQTIPVFLKHRMACVGCSMSPFETLDSAAKIYGLRPEAFVEELRAAAGAGISGDSPTAQENPV